MSEALTAAMVAARFSAEDEARRAWLDEQIRREGARDLAEKESRDGNLCKRGHPLAARRDGGSMRRYCPTCHALAEKARRAA